MADGEEEPDGVSKDALRQAYNDLHLAAGVLSRHGDHGLAAALRASATGLTGPLDLPEAQPVPKQESEADE